MLSFAAQQLIALHTPPSKRPPRPSPATGDAGTGRRILDHMQEGELYSSKDLQDALGLLRGTVNSTMKRLEAKGKVRQVGSRKTDGKQTEHVYRKF